MPSEFSRVQLEKMDKAELIELVEVLSARNEKLQIEAHQQSRLARRFDDQLAKHSQNSRPASDGRRELLTRSLRRKQGRKRGGQKGHPGHTLFASDQAVSSTRTGNRGHPPASALLAGPEINKGGQSA